MWAWLKMESLLSGVFQRRCFPSTQSFPELAGPDGSCLLCGTIGPAPLVAPAVLDKSLSPTLAIRDICTRRWIVIVSLLWRIGRTLAYIRQAFNCSIGSWSSLVQHLHINCLKIMVVFLALKNLPTSSRRAPCPHHLDNLI